MLIMMMMTMMMLMMIMMMLMVMMMMMMLMKMVMMLVMMLMMMMVMMMMMIMLMMVITKTGIPLEETPAVRLSKYHPFLSWHDHETLCRSLHDFLDSRVDISKTSQTYTSIN